MSKIETDEELVHYFENDASDWDKLVFKIAKYIEISGMSYGYKEGVKGTVFFRPSEGKDLGHTMDEWWNLLTIPEKRERLRQAMGAWMAIQDIGVDHMLQSTMTAYLDEK